MKRVYFLNFGIFFFLLFFTITQAQAYIFTRNLKLGDIGNDVLELQKILNASVDTRISLSGIGSMGQETTYFGLLTQNAVIKYQNKYKNEILVPSGLVYGTGFVGPSTLKKLNSIDNSSNRTTSSNVSQSMHTYEVTAAEKIDIYSTDNQIKANVGRINAEINAAIREKRAPSLNIITSAANATKSAVTLSKPSVVVAKSGSTLSLLGSGFEATNNIYFGQNYVARGITSYGTSLSFAIPQLPPGKYDVAVKNSRGVSNSIFFVIQGTSNPIVKIDSISPTSGPQGQRVVMRGAGFTAQNNEIFTTFGTIKGVASPDGKTLSFNITVDGLDEISQLQKQGRSLPIGIIVVNDNGYAEYKSVFTLQY